MEASIGFRDYLRSEKKRKKVDESSVDFTRAEDQALNLEK